MPGLLRGVARTAVIAGTATAVSNGVSRRQVSRWDKKAQEQEASSRPPPCTAGRRAVAAPPAEDDMAAKVEALKQLAALKGPGESSPTTSSRPRKPRSLG